MQDAAQWPGFRGPGRDGVATGNPPLRWSAEENLAWRRELPGPGASSPVVVGDAVFVTCYSGYGAYLDDGGEPGALRHHLVCLDRGTGEVRWSREVEGALDGEASRTQVNEHGFATPTPVADAETIYAYFGPAGVHAFDLRDGEPRWSADLGEADPEAGPPSNQVVRDGEALKLRWGAASSPLLHRGVLYVNASEESDSIRAFDAGSGELLWKRESPDLEGCAMSPVAVGRGEHEVIAVVLGGRVWGLDPRSGEERWSVETGTRGGMSPTPVADDRVLYTFGGDGEGFAIQIAPTAGEPRVVWQGVNLGIPSPLLCGDELLLVSSQGHGTRVAKRDGEVIERLRLEGRTGGIYASPVLVAERLYLATRRRGVFVYSAKPGFDLIARNTIDGDDSQLRASPAIVGDTLFLRSDRYMYCIRQS